MKARHFAIAAWAVAGAAGFIAAAGAAFGLRLNTTASAPVGLWRIAPLDAQHIERGTLVSICPPPLAVVVAMRAQGYLHTGDCADTATTPLLKPVVAVPGDIVTVTPDGPLHVNGTELAHSAPEPNMPAWTPGTYTVHPGEIWLLSRYSAGSFDSRYFGPVAVANLRGRAVPVLILGDVDSMTQEAAGHDRF